MNLLAKRKDNARMMAEGRFIRHVLTEEANSLVDAQTKKMNEFGFSDSAFFSDRTTNMKTDFIQIQFSKLHRFVDIKTRKTKTEIIKKKAYPIYNRIVFGHIPNVVRRLSFGFTDDVVESFKKLEN